MATYTFVNFEHEETAILAGLTSIRSDLHGTIQFCKYLESQSVDWKPPYEILEAFSTAILVRYSRAFVSSVRKKLGEEALASLSEEQKGKHKFFRAFRDKHIAHSVNAFEDTQIQARYCQERVHEEGIIQVTTSHFWISGLSSENVSDMIELCEKLLGYVDERVKEESSRLLTILRSMPVAKVLSFPASPPSTPDFSKIHKRRPKPWLLNTSH